MFYQVEGLAVDEGITMADLQGHADRVRPADVRPNVRTRFRCDYFPFVEPGVDMSISCHVCDGGAAGSARAPAGSRSWARAWSTRACCATVGYDPERYTGFAFGMGPERIAMVKYGIHDIRLFYGNDLRFLEQFA